jgi:GNAT superfamily N-acetyltransferase
MSVSDIPAGLRLCRASGWNQLEEDWRAFLGAAGGGGRIAEREGRALGTVAYLRYGAFSWLSMMLVDPEARRGGVGTRLMETALEALADESCVRLDATPAGEPLYRKFGFEGEFELVRAKTVALPGGFAAAGEDARPMGERDLPEVFARDREVFGADRSRVLESFYRRAPEMAWTVRRGSGLVGYCFGRPGFLYRQVGPVVADTVTVARQLVGRCLSESAGAAVAVDVPRAAVEWLGSAGFVVERPFLRMSRGLAMSPPASAQQFAIAGPEFG